MDRRKGLEIVNCIPVLLWQPSAGVSPLDDVDDGQLLETLGGQDGVVGDVDHALHAGATVGPLLEADLHHEAFDQVRHVKDLAAEDGGPGSCVQRQFSL